MEREEFLSVYRHSLAHIMAKAVIEIYGTTREKYVILYTVVGIVLMSAALIFYAYGLFLKLRQQKNEN